MIKKIKVSELPYATSLEGLSVLGVDAVSNKSVQASMNLLQGNIGVKGDKGDKGDSGVYVGTTPPTDGSVKVAINPNGDTYEGVPVGGMAGDVLTKTSTTDFATSWGSPLRALFVARGAVYNAHTGFYELNGLKDITEAEMIDIYTFTSYVPSSIIDCTNLFYYSGVRTNFTPKSGTYNMYVGGTTISVEAAQMFRSKYIPEVINLGVRGFKIKGNCYYWAYSDTLNTRFKRVIGVLDISEVTSFSSPFGYCEGLEDVQIKGCKVSVEMKHSKALTRDSIVYLITNAANTTPITITLHADALARLTPEDIALANSKKITLIIA